MVDPIPLVDPILMVDPIPMGDPIPMHMVEHIPMNTSLTRIVLFLCHPLPPMFHSLQRRSTYIHRAITPSTTHLFLSFFQILLKLSST